MKPSDKLQSKFTEKSLRCPKVQKLDVLV